MGKHQLNKEVIIRLKRVNGHLSKVIQMLESQEECLKVAQQLQAVESGLLNAKKTYIHDHIEHCLTDARDSKAFSARLKEFRVIAKYL